MDGSVTIGVSLDTTAVLSALSSLETRMASFGNGLSDALINPVGESCGCGAYVG